MDRCLDCNSMIAKHEAVCVECGTKVGGESASMADCISMLVSILFYLSLAALITSPFIDKVPSFTVCFMTTLALLFLMRTAKDSAEKARKR